LQSAAGGITLPASDLNLSSVSLPKLTILRGALTTCAPVVRIKTAGSTEAGLSPSRTATYVRRYVSPGRSCCHEKIRVLAVLCLTLAVLMPPVFGQGRPRRVGSAPSTQPPARTTPSSPQPTSSQPGSNPSDRVNQVGRPPAPPVLRGANRDPNEPQPTATPPKSNEPEEFGEGDILRVETTLVSIPVSVMDRDASSFRTSARKIFTFGRTA